MKAAVYYNNNDIRIVDIPIPKIKQDEILVKVKASGICGTDVMEWYRIKKAPRILGHEITGEITESKSEKFKVGQRVFVSHHVPCDECKYCMEGNYTACDTLHNGNYEPGGYSEYVRVPKINVEKGTYILPDNVSYEEGTMIEPLACAIRGLNIISLKKEHNVLILGSGVAGLTNIQIAKLRGARVIATDIEEYRLKKAREFDADETINAKEIINTGEIINAGEINNAKEIINVNGTINAKEIINAKKNLNIKADRVIICTGAMQAVEQAFRCIDRKGIMLFFAVPSRNIEIPIVDFWRNELTITSSYGATPADLKESLELIKTGRVNVNGMITDKLPLDEIQKGFRIVSEAKNSLKVVLVF